MSSGVLQWQATVSPLLRNLPIVLRFIVVAHGPIETDRRDLAGRSIGGALLRREIRFWNQASI